MRPGTPWPTRIVSCLIPRDRRDWMAHPFSGVPTDFVVTYGGRRWFANCVWDGLAILALLGDGVLKTHSPATGDQIVFEVSVGKVLLAEALVHFLAPGHRFWEDIGLHLSAHHRLPVGGRASVVAPIQGL